MRKACLAVLWVILVISPKSQFGQSSLPDEAILNYSARNKPLNAVLKELSNQTGVSLVYSESKIPSEKLVTCQFENKALGTVLSEILQPLDFSYQLVGNQIVLIKIPHSERKGSLILSGYLRDDTSKEYLIGASVYLNDMSIGTYTNEYGFFSLKLPATTNRVLFSYIGYETKAVEWNMKQDTIVDLFLKPEELVLNEVLVKEPTRDYYLETPGNQTIIPVHKINNGNHLMGEADPLRFLTILPGVQSGADGIGGLNVRGGSYDQNLVLLDGIPIYNSGHALGIFSIFNSSSVKNVTMIDGAIPARYSGRLSSVIDVQTKDGNMEKTSGDASLSLLSLKAGIEGPIVKDKVSYHISARRTFLDVWLKELSRFIGQESGTKSEANYYFYDLNGKIHWRINQKNRLILNAYNGKDDFANFSRFETNEISDFNESDLSWGNSMFSLRWSSQWGNNLFSKVSAYSTKYNIKSFKQYEFNQRSANDTLNDYWAYLFASSIMENGAKADIDYIISPKHYVRMGAGFITRSFRPGVFYVDQLKTPELNGQDLSLKLLENQFSSIHNGFNESYVYAEDEWQINSFVSVLTGLHGSILSGKNLKDPFYSFQPRIGVLVSAGSFHIKFGAANMYQYMHLLSNTGLGLPTDVWIGAGSTLPPQNAWIFNGSARYDLKNGWRLFGDIYYKSMNDLTHFKEGESIDIQEGVPYEEFIPTGKGEAYGLESGIEKTIGKTNLMASYTFSISNRNFEDLNLGNPFPFAYNRNHAIKAYVYRKLSEFSDLSLTWTYGSGNYYSKPEEVIVDINGKITLLYPEKNNAQFQPYHRLDIGFGFYNKFSWGKSRLFLGVYNVYNRKNYYYSDIGRNKKDPDILEINNYSLMPLTPNISYTVTF